MNPSDSEDPAAFHLRNKHELLYECRFVGQYVPDKEHRSAKPDILYRKTENKMVLFSTKSIFFVGGCQSFGQVFEEFFLVYEIEM